MNYKGDKMYHILKHVLPLYLLFLLTAVMSADSPGLYETSFKDGAEKWQKHDQALVSDVSRRKGIKVF